MRSVYLRGSNLRRRDRWRSDDPDRTRSGGKCDADCAARCESAAYETLAPAQRPVLKLEPEPRRFGPRANISANVKTTITPSTTHWAQFSIVENATTQSAIPTIRAITL
jgi:hypothetical protein